MTFLTKNQGHFRQKNQEKTISLYPKDAHSADNFVKHPQTFPFHEVLLLLSISHSYRLGQLYNRLRQRPLCARASLFKVQSCNGCHTTLYSSSKQRTFLHHTYWYK